MQHRFDSFMEAICNVAVGLSISMTANAIFIPWATGASLPITANGALAVIYTAISLIRTYAIRRAFNGRSIWKTIKEAI